MKTLYISDLDGTLLQPDVEISETSIRILNELIDRGMLFSVATARTIASVKPILRNLKVTMPIILMNGVCIYDPGKDDYIRVEAFEKASKEELMSVITGHKLKGFAYSVKDGKLSTYYEDLNSKALWDFYDERVTRYNKKFTQVDSFSRFLDVPLIYFSLIDRKEALEPIYRIVEAIPDLNCVMYKDNYSPDGWFLEIFSQNASKYHAAQFLRNYLNLDRIVCFGDNRNDLSLFEAGDYKLAVANAVSELKQKADEVIGSNVNDGVAAWLKRNVKL